LYCNHSISDMYAHTYIHFGVSVPMTCRQRTVLISIGCTTNVLRHTHWTCSYIIYYTRNYGMYDMRVLSFFPDTHLSYRNVIVSSL